MASPDGAPASAGAAGPCGGGGDEDYGGLGAIAGGACTRALVAARLFRAGAGRGGAGHERFRWAHSALVGARQARNELAGWFGALPKIRQPEKYLAGLTRGLRLVGARKLQVPRAEAAYARLLASNDAVLQEAAWESSRHFELTAL